MKRKLDLVQPILQSNKLRNMPFIVGESFLELAKPYDQNNALPWEHAKQWANPLYKLKNQHPKNSDFWLTLRSIATLTKCKEMGAFIDKNALIQHDRANYIKIFLVTVQFLVEQNDLRLAGLLNKFQAQNLVESELILDTCINLGLQRFKSAPKNILYQKLQTFKQDYPAEYEAIFENTYPELLCLEENIVFFNPDHYYARFFQILPFFCVNPDKLIHPSHVALSLMRKYFQQQKDIDLAVPTNLQKSLYDNLMDFINLDPEQREEHLTFLLKHNLLVPLKYYIYENHIFANNEETKKLFKLAFSEHKIMHVCFIIKLHILYLSSLTEPNLHLLETPHESVTIDGDYFSKIIPHYFSFVNECFNARTLARDRQSYQWPLRFAIQNAFIRLITSENKHEPRQTLEYFHKLTNFYDHDTLIALMKICPVAVIAEIYKNSHFKADQRFQYISIAVQKKSSLLLREILKRYPQNTLISDPNYQELNLQLFENKLYNLLLVSLFYKYKIQYNKTIAIGRLMLELLQSQDNHEHSFLSFFLQTQDNKLLALSCALNKNSEIIVEKLCNNHSFIANLSLEEGMNFVDRCFNLIESSVHIKNRLPSLKILLKQSVFIQLLCVFHEQSYHAWQSQQNWSARLNKCTFVDLECFTLVQNQMRILQDNLPHGTLLYGIFSKKTDPTNSITNQELPPPNL